MPVAAGILLQRCSRNCAAGIAPLIANLPGFGARCREHPREDLQLAARWPVGKDPL
jgi:hypothetical protein